MKPILSALKRVRFLSDIPAMDSPPIRTSPRSNSSRPERQLRSVVLPHPEGPMTATISPRAIERSTPRRARTRTPPAAYSFSTPRASTMVPSAASSRATISLAFPIKTRSFLCSSRFVDTQIGSATVYAEPRGDPFGTADGDVAGAPEDDHGHDARGSGEHHLQAAGATIHL